MVRLGTVSEEGRFPCLFRRSLPSVLLLVVLVLVMGLAACSLPRFVLLTDPLSAAEHNDLGVSYEAGGNLEPAKEAYAAAARKDPAWDQPLINLGNVHAARDDWPQAADAYRRALKRNPRNPEAMNNLAYALLRQGNPNEALPWAEQAVAMALDNPLFLATKALVLVELDRPAEASDLLDQALNLLSPEAPLYKDILSRKKLLSH